MKKITLPILSLFVVSSFLFLLTASEDTDAVESRDKFEDGEAKSEGAFHQGLVAEYGTLTVKLDEWIACDYCKDYAYELRNDGKRILKFIKNASAVGKGGNKFKRLALDVTRSAIDMADDVIENEYRYPSQSTIQKFKIAQTAFESYQFEYARNNGMHLSGPMDRGKLD